MKYSSIIHRASLWTSLSMAVLGISLKGADIQPESAATVILGAQQTPSAVTLSDVRGVCRHAATGKVFVTDSTNHRVLRYSSAQAYLLGGAAEAVFGQPDLGSARPGIGPTSLFFPEDTAIDSAGNLWIADGGNNRVLRFANAAARTAGPNGMAADGVLGQPDFFSWQPLPIPAADDMDRPVSIAVEGNRLWIVDYYRGRVLRYENAASKANGAVADGVLGQPDFSAADFETSATVIGSPIGVAVESGGRLWVADAYGNRVVRFDNAAAKPNGGAADGVLGQSDLDSGLGVVDPITGTSFTPANVAVEPAGRLWIADLNANRVLRFDAAATKSNGAAADGVLGAPDLETVGDGFGDSSFQPGWIEADTAGNLWVSDFSGFYGGRQRLLRYALAGSLTDGAPATSALGTASLTEEWPATSATVMSSPSGVAIDPVSGKIFVSDSGHNRVLRFASWSTLSSGAAAEAVLGQPDFDSSFPDTPANFSQPGGIALDSAGRLYVADTYNHRVLRFDGAASKASGAAANAVLGQPNFTSVTEPAGPNSSRMNTPSGVAIDSTGRLWVSDTGHNRVLRYDSPHTKANGAAADGVVGQTDFVSADEGLSATGLTEPTRVHAAGSHLWVRDAGNFRVLGYDLTTLPAAGGAAAKLLGQDGMDTADRGDLSGLGGMAADTAGRLWVANDLELIRFNQPLLGESQDRNLGYTPDDGLFYGNTAPQGMAGAVDAAVDPAGNLWVADAGNNRVLRFSNMGSTLFTITGTGLTGSPQSYYLKFKSTSETPDGPPKTTKYRVDTSTDLSTWTLGSVHTTTGAEITWTDPASPSGKKYYRVKEVP